MKKGLSLVLSLIMVLGILTSIPLTVNAASVDDLTFELNEDGESYTITACDESAEGELVIPETYNGLPVTRIDDSAFDLCESIISITIPDSIISIGRRVFSGCVNLVSVTIGNGVKSIGEDAFFDCENLISITIPDSVTTIGDSVFSYCTSLTSINVDESNISYSSVNGVLFNKNKTFLIKYPSGKGEAQYIIPATVTNIDDNAFDDCEKLTSINVDENNLVYSSFDGVLFNKDKTTLIRYPGGKINTEYTVPNGVLNIGTSAFSRHKYLETINVGDSIEYIGFGAFSDCEKLSTVKLGRWLKEIGYFAFSGLSNIKDIYYNGTAEEWEKINIRYHNYGLEDGTLHFHTHTPSSWITDKKATVNSAGSKHKECTECGEVLETATIAQLKCSKPTLKSIENSEYGVLVKWGTVKGADKYYIYRKVKGGSYSRIGSTTNTYYTDKTAKSGKKYYYIVKAINEAGASSSSSSLSKLYLADPTLKTPTSTKNGVSLKWTKSAGVEGYIIYRKTGSGSYEKLKTEKGVSNLSYVDKSAKKGKKYTYKVKAYYSKTYSAYSNTKTITDKY